MDQDNKCFACGRKMPKSRRLVNVAREDQNVFVGPDCFQRVIDAGDAGYQPPRGGPILYVCKAPTSCADNDPPTADEPTSDETPGVAPDYARDMLIWAARAAVS